MVTKKQKLNYTTDLGKIHNLRTCGNVVTSVEYRCGNESSAIAEMGDRGHNRHRPKRGGAVPLS